MPGVRRIDEKNSRRLETGLYSRGLLRIGIVAPLEEPMANYDVVFEGGGAKGIAFVGALEVLQQRQHTIRRAIGTSAGAITATLCAAGYAPAELLSAIIEKKDGKPRFTSFMDIPEARDFSPAMQAASLTQKVLNDINLPGFPEWVEKKIDVALMKELLQHRIYARLFSFIECGGFYSGRTFLAWMQEKLAAKGIGPNDTLADFAAKKKDTDLSMVVSDTTDMEMLVLNNRTAPNVPVAHAVRMSMSIPFVWQEVIWQQAWGTYMGRAKEGNIVVDGGLLSNFPIRLIAETDANIEQIMGSANPNGAGNLGLLIDERLPVPGAANTDKTPEPGSSLRTIKRTSRLVDTMMGASDNEAILNFSKYVCRLPAKGYGTLEFDMTEGRREAFLEAARTAMKNHLGAAVSATGSGN